MDDVASEVRGCAVIPFRSALGKNAALERQPCLRGSRGPALPLRAADLVDVGGDLPCRRTGLGHLACGSGRDCE